MNRPMYLCIQFQPFHMVGSQPPAGYVDRSEWAQVQIEGGLKAVQCPDGLWRFPREIKKLKNPDA